MSDTATETAVEATSAPLGVAPEKIMIHLRFNPDGTVSEIGERPAGVKAHQWFVFLSRHTHNCYEALSGGRGLFRLERAELDALKAACAAEQPS